MDNVILSNSTQFKQENLSKDGDKNLLRESFKSFIESIIKEYGTTNRFGIGICVSDIPLHVQKIFLSYLSDIDEYEEACKSLSSLQALISEYKKNMQYLLDEYKDDVWHEFMQDMGLHLCREKDTGYVYYNSK